MSCALLIHHEFTSFSSHIHAWSWPYSRSLFSLVLHDVMVAECTSVINIPLLSLIETDDKMRAFAEVVFASETKDEDIRDEISLFDVADDCPILHEEMAHHLHTEDDAEKRWDDVICKKSCHYMLRKYILDHLWCGMLPEFHNDYLMIILEENSVGFHNKHFRNFDSGWSQLLYLTSAHSQ